MGTHADARLASLRTFNGLGKTLEFTTLEMSQEDILDRVMKNMTEDAYPENCSERSSAQNGSDSKTSGFQTTVV